MIEPEQVPYDAMRAGLQAWMGSEGTIMSAMERAIAAALNAWPGVTTTSWFENGVRKAVLNIPLPLEMSDE